VCTAAGCGTVVARYLLKSHWAEKRHEGSPPPNAIILSAEVTKLVDAEKARQAAASSASSSAAVAAAAAAAAAAASSKQRRGVKRGRTSAGAAALVSDGGMSTDSDDDGALAEAGPVASVLSADDVIDVDKAIFPTQSRVVSTKQAWGPGTVTAVVIGREEGILYRVEWDTHGRASRERYQLLPAAAWLPTSRRAREESDFAAMEDGRAGDAAGVR
jgi:hypothetical protein